MKYEYVIRRIHGSTVDFEVAKFGDMEVQPLAVYNVRYDHSKGSGKCDCPAAQYRGTGSNDKHVLMVREWVMNGDSFHKKEGV